VVPFKTTNLAGRTTGEIGERLAEQIAEGIHGTTKTAVRMMTYRHEILKYQSFSSINQ